MWTKGTQKNCSNKWVWLNAERRSWIALCIAVSLYYRPLCHCTNSVNMAFRCEGHGIAELLILSTNQRAGTIEGGLAVGISIEGALGESVQRRFSAAKIGRIFRFQHTSMKQKVHDFYAQKLCSKEWGSGDITWNFQYGFANIDGCKLRRYVKNSTRPRYTSACSAHMGSLHSLVRTCLSHLRHFLTACRHIAELTWFWDHQSIKTWQKTKIWRNSSWVAWSVIVFHPAFLLFICANLWAWLLSAHIARDADSANHF